MDVVALVEPEGRDGRGTGEHLVFGRVEHAADDDRIRLIDGNHIVPLQIGRRGIDRLLEHGQVLLWGAHNLGS